MKCGTSLSCTSTSFASKVQAGAINVWKHLVRPGSVWQCVFKRFLITTPFSKDPFFSIHVDINLLRPGSFVESNSAGPSLVFGKHYVKKPLWGLALHLHHGQGQAGTVP